MSSGGWVRFTRAWDWNPPKFKGRVTKHFPLNLQIRLPRLAYQSALAAGVAVCIPNPRHAQGEPEDNHG